MRPPFYITQLKRDLEQWIKAGLVPAENRDRILESVGNGSTTGRLETTIAVFGAILIGAGALSFVGANWAAMTKPVRLVVLFGGMWLAYAAAVAFYQSGRNLIAQAFVLLGVLLFGSNIWFIAQTYNINSHFPDGTLLWGVGALAAAVLVPSRAALAAALAIGSYWTWQETIDFNQFIHLPFLPFWAVCAAQATYLGWRPGIHLSALSLIMWLVISHDSIQSLLGWSDAEVVSLYVFLPLLIWSVTQIREPGPNGVALMVGHYAFFMFLVAFSIVHLFDGKPGGSSSSWLLCAIILSLLSLGAVVLSMQRKGATAIDLAGTAFAAIVTISYVMNITEHSDRFDIPYLICTLVVILWSVFRGARMDDRFVVNWSVAAFGVWVLYTYFELFSGLMDQAVFFTVGGVLLIVLALALEPLRRSLVNSTNTAVQG
ncbi:MAG: DUF2157 domain-containing protein [Micropepsaceae bacterium]